LKKLKFLCEVEEKEKAGGMGEDDKFRLKEEMQKIINASVSLLEQMAEKKEKEIRS
jgi:ribosome recycling factor